MILWLVNVWQMYKKIRNNLKKQVFINLTLILKLHYQMKFHPNQML
jgi:hypothetical protein